MPDSSMFMFDRLRRFFDNGRRVDAALERVGTLESNSVEQVRLFNSFVSDTNKKYDDLRELLVDLDNGQKRLTDADSLSSSEISELRNKLAEVRAEVDKNKVVPISIPIRQHKEVQSTLTGQTVPTYIPDQTDEDIIAYFRNNENKATFMNITKAIGIHPMTLSRRLKKMIDNEIVSKKKEGNSTMYFLVRRKEEIH